MASGRRSPPPWAAAAEVAVGRAYVHDIELGGDENPALGTSVEVCDDAGRRFAATVTDRTGSR